MSRDKRFPPLPGVRERRFVPTRKGQPVAARSLYAVIFDTVRAIPHGRVATYGQVALMAGLPGSARLVGYALHTLPEGTDVPWHRVINARGRISLHPQFGGLLQRALLEAEGVAFGPDDTVSLEEFRWQGPGMTLPFSGEGGSSPPGLRN